MHNLIQELKCILFQMCHRVQERMVCQQGKKEKQVPSRKAKVTCICWVILRMMRTMDVCQGFSAHEDNPSSGNIKGARRGSWEVVMGVTGFTFKTDLFHFLRCWKLEFLQNHEESCIKITKAKSKTEKQTKTWLWLGRAGPN